MKKILVTGANGFVGQSFTSYIRSLNGVFKLLGVDIISYKNDSSIKLCNLTVLEELVRLLSDFLPDYIFHFAGGRMSDEKILLESNTYTTKTLCEAILKISNYNPRVIIPGSAAEYGLPVGDKVLIREDHVPCPMSWYGLVKLTQTNLALMYGKYGIDIVVARMFNILGASTPPTLAGGRFAQQIVKIEHSESERVIHTKRLDGKRDFLDIQDICQALLHICEHGESQKIYNVCSGIPVSIRTLLEKMIHSSKVNTLVIDEDTSSGSRSFDIIGDNTLLKNIQSWKPKVSIEESIKKTLNSYRERHL